MEKQGWACLSPIKDKLVENWNSTEPQNWIGPIVDANLAGNRAHNIHLEKHVYLLHFEIWFNRYIRQILSGWLCRVLLLISPLFSKPWFHLVWTLGWKLPGGTLYHMSYIAHRQIKLQSSSVDLYWLSIIFPWNWLAIKSVIVVKS